MPMPDISYFENSVDPDQLPSEKPADRDPHCFQLCLIKHANYCNSVCLERSVVH